MRYVADMRHGFGQRPHYEPRELDREFEWLAANFLKAKYGDARFPFETEDLKTFILYGTGVIWGIFSIRVFAKPRILKIRVLNSAFSKLKTRPSSRKRE